MRNLDHFVVTVEHMAGAQQAYRRLGFSVMPKARHAAIGTAWSVLPFTMNLAGSAGDFSAAITGAVDSMRAAIKASLRMADFLPREMDGSESARVGREAQRAFHPVSGM